MFYIGDTIRTSNKVSKKDYESLKRNGIKPGTYGEIVDIIYVIDFNGTRIGMNENSLDEISINKENNNVENDTLNTLKNMFGMK